MRWSAVLLAFCILPQVVTASVRINEVAWMGTSESYLCNWVELSNQSETPVDVTDWTLEIDDTVRALRDGTGETATIPGGGFLLLERVTNTCPDPVPEVAGWYLTLGNLPNAGATLTLRRADDTMADRVVGGAEWQNLGGDNATKETAQRTSDGWVTASGTPGAANSSRAAFSTNADRSTDNDTAQSDAGATTELRLYDPADGTTAQTLDSSDSQLTVTIQAPGTTYVGQPLEVASDATGVGDGVINSLHYQWNFGDRHTTTKVEPTHAYAFPGTYVITLRASYASYAAIARHEVTVLPVRLSVGRDAEQNIQIHNTAPYELDLSGYTVRGTQSVTFPERTIILPEQTLTIERAALEDAVAGLVTVQDREGATIASNASAVRDQYLADRSSADTVPAPAPTVASSQYNFSAANTVVARPSTTIRRATTAVATTTSGQFVTEPPAASSAPDAAPSWLEYWPYGALAGLLVLTAVLLFWPPRRSSPAVGTSDLFQ